MSKRRENTDSAVTKALATWSAAPAHVKAMAGKWAEPLLLAMLEMNAELQEMRYLINQNGGSNGQG